MLGLYDGGKQCWTQNSPNTAENHRVKLHNLRMKWHHDKWLVTAANPNCLSRQNNINIALRRSTTFLASDFTNRVRTILFLKESIFEPPQTKQSHILDRLLSHRFHLTWRHCLRSNVQSQNWKEWKKNKLICHRSAGLQVLIIVSTQAIAKKWYPHKLKGFRRRVMIWGV